MKRARLESPDVELSSAGLHLPGTVLWLDARKRRDLSFVSHAFVPELVAHRRVIATEATLRLLRLRLGRPLTGAIASPYRRPLALGRLTLELYPSGHCLGAAQICVTRGGKRIGYARDVDADPSAVAAPVEIVQCDTLVLRGPPPVPGRLPQDALEAMERSVSLSLSAGMRPIVICSGPEAAMETIKRLADHDFPVRAPRPLWRIAKIHEERGVALPGAGPLGKPPAPGEVVVALPPARKPAWWAERRVPVEEHVLGPLRRNDFSELVRYARQTGASKVYTVGEMAHALADALEGAGIAAEPLVDPAQLPLF